MDYRALVVGGGHAGIEAGLALSRIGFKTLLITQNLDAIGRLSCNPAIGGLSKGNIVREVDALGGEMAHLIDRSMIQFRILNRKRGPAVQAPRAQADKYTYARLAKETLEPSVPVAPPPLVDASFEANDAALKIVADVADKQNVKNQGGTTPEAYPKHNGGRADGEKSMGSKLDH